MHSRRDRLGHWSLRRNVASVLLVPRHPVRVDVVVLPVVRVWSNSDARVVVRHDVSIPVPRSNELSQVRAHAHNHTCTFITHCLKDRLPHTQKQSYTHTHTHTRTQICTHTHAVTNSGCPVHACMFDCCSIEHSPVQLGVVGVEGCLCGRSIAVCDPTVLGFPPTSLVELLNSRSQTRSLLLKVRKNHGELRGRQVLLLWDWGHLLQDQRERARVEKMWAALENECAKTMMTRVACMHACIHRSCMCAHACIHACIQHNDSSAGAGLRSNTHCTHTTPRSTSIKG